MADTTQLPAAPVEERVDFHQVLAALDTVILILDRKNRVRFANPPAEEFFGLSRGTFLESRLEDLVSEDSPLLALVKRASQRQGVVSQREMHLNLGRDSEARADVRAVPLPEQTDQMVLSILPLGFGEEIGRLMSGQGRGTHESGMGAILAHEVKNPLAGIRGAAQLLARQIDPDHEHLPRLIIDECDRINALIDRMELLGSRGLGTREPVNIHRILDQVITLEKSGAPEGFSFQRQYDPSLPLLEGDPGLLIQCFQNLVRNAIEAAGGVNGTVKISSAFRPGFSVKRDPAGQPLPLPLEVVISDNGPGVDEADRERIFAPFVSARPGGGGTGLGLALVRRIVAAHGGLVSCEPSAAGGRFRILFPIPKPQDHKTEGAAL
ncbi:MAG: PAS domain-containing protein [Proteobacteria bacterium]|nr:PAS domain-containing protein [Pseudomonadota bacterium]